ncbi:MAG: STAS domain-containing protein [Gammaproteobacteria bacterium]|jgi:phospholipid transport system transporter-binding protein|nr:STAS domain-containing protein [Gammaproteobacteria bacterium]MBT7307075.1 STAS domain-containing protein [Gammaproteobacteria bacterium]
MVSELSLITEVDGEISLKGELTFATVPTALREAPPLFVGQGELRVDLSKVRRLDSAGLALLMEWLRFANGQQRNIYFLNPPPQLERLARISGVSELLPIV